MFDYILRNCFICLCFVLYHFVLFGPAYWVDLAVCLQKCLLDHCDSPNVVQAVLSVIYSLNNFTTSRVVLYQRRNLQSSRVYQHGRHVAFLTAGWLCGVSFWPSPAVVFVSLGHLSADARLEPQNKSLVHQPFTGHLLQEGLHKWQIGSCVYTVCF